MRLRNEGRNRACKEGKNSFVAIAFITHVNRLVYRKNRNFCISNSLSFFSFSTFQVFRPFRFVHFARNGRIALAQKTTC